MSNSYSTKSSARRVLRKLSDVFDNIEHCNKFTTEADGAFIVDIEAARAWVLASQTMDAVIDGVKTEVAPELPTEEELQQPAPAPAPEPVFMVRDLTGMEPEDQYAATQTGEEQIYLLGNGAVAAMVKAWPTLVEGSAPGFHKLAEGVTWEEYEGGAYLPLVEAARKALLPAPAKKERVASSIKKPGVVAKGIILSMPGAARKDIIKACMDAGVTYNTADYYHYELVVRPAKESQNA